MGGHHSQLYVARKTTTPRTLRKCCEKWPILSWWVICLEMGIFLDSKHCMILLWKLTYFGPGSFLRGSVAGEWYAWRYEGFSVPTVTFLEGMSFFECFICERSYVPPSHGTCEWLLREPWTCCNVVSFGHANSPVAAPALHHEGNYET